MQDLTHTGRMATIAEPAPDAAPPPWHVEVGALLARAAASAIEHGVDVDAFMHGAWSAYVESRPGFKEYLEELQIRHHIEELRKAGQLGRA